MDLLSKIIASKQKRVTEAKNLISLDEMRTRAHQRRAGAPRHALVAALANETKTNIIAEFKRRSPSKGEINSGVEAAKMAAIYQKAGAAAVSVLTEEDYFDGSLDDLHAARGAVSLPILRKDFIVEDYQVYESATAGADALLLIVAALDETELVRLRKLAEDDLGMDALVEVHTKEELDKALGAGARLIGVNNRDLRTFTVSIATSTQLASAVPDHIVLVSESGLNPEQDRSLRAVGYKGFLVGEALMRASDPEQALQDFIEARTEDRRSKPKQVVQIKICGITNLADARAAIAVGANMLGFNFYRQSPRFIEPLNARAIIETLRSDRDRFQEPVTMVGIFVNEPAENIVRFVELAGLDAVQLHGDESIQFCEQLKRLLPNRFLIKAVATQGEPTEEQLKQYDVDAIMLDAFDANLRGGTGRSFDWTIARRTQGLVSRLFLAGGLSPENVAAAVAEVQPYAVDACSLLESSPGKKDAQRMKEFVRAARGE